MRALHWFRAKLRLRDNAGLAAAAAKRRRLASERFEAARRA